MPPENQDQFQIPTDTESSKLKRKSILVYSVGSVIVLIAVVATAFLILRNKEIPEKEVINERVALNPFGWQIYTNEKLGFEFRYPDEWDFKKSQGFTAFGEANFSFEAGDGSYFSVDTSCTSEEQLERFVNKRTETDNVRFGNNTFENYRVYGFPQFGGGEELLIIDSYRVPYSSGVGVLPSECNSLSFVVDDIGIKQLEFNEVLSTFKFVSKGGIPDSSFNQQDQQDQQEPEDQEIESFEGPVVEKVISSNKLTLVRPDGGEVFSRGSDVIVEWNTPEQLATGLESDQRILEIYLMQPDGIILGLIASSLYGSPYGYQDCTSDVLKQVGRHVCLWNTKIVAYNNGSDFGVTLVPSGSYKILIITRDSPQPQVAEEEEGEEGEGENEEEGEEVQQQNEGKPVVGFGTPETKEDLYDKFSGGRVSSIRNKSGMAGDGEVIANYYLTSYDISDSEFSIE